VWPPAAIVVENAGVLVTRNLRDFLRIPHLNLEDWTA
jgi:predicted nucleic acid-binding protein